MSATVHNSSMPRCRLFSPYAYSSCHHHHIGYMTMVYQTKDAEMGYVVSVINIIARRSNPDGNNDSVTHTRLYVNLWQLHYDVDTTLRIMTATRQGRGFYYCMSSALIYSPLMLKWKCVIHLHTYIQTSFRICQKYSAVLVRLWGKGVWTCPIPRISLSFSLILDNYLRSLLRHVSIK